MKKITFCIPYLSNGGAQRVAIQIANHYSKYHNVEIISLSKSGSFIDEIDKKIKIYNFNKSKFIFSLFNIIAYLKNKNPDYIFCAQPHTLFTIYFAKIIALWRGKIIVRENNNYIETQFRKISLNLKIQRKLINYLYKYIYLVIYPCEEIYKNNKINNSKVIYNPIDIELISELSKENIEEDFLISNDFILAVGSLTDQKRFDDIIKSLSFIENKKINLVIIGEGKRYNKLLKLSKDLNVEHRCFFLGFKKNPYKYMRQCKLFVLSSAWEGLPNVLLQALACFAPILSSNCLTGPREILQNGKIETLYNVGNISELTDKINIKLLDNNKINYDVSDLSKFCSKNIFSQYNDIF